jgi:hypothetical protein
MCYARQPYINQGSAPNAATPMYGHYSGYKQISSYNNAAFTDASGAVVYQPVPATAGWSLIAGTNFFSGSFGAPDWVFFDWQTGQLKLNNIVVSGPGSADVEAHSGAVNIGTTVDQNMCGGAADFMMFQVMSQNSYQLIQVVPIYFTWMDASGGDWANLCIIGSEIGNKQGQSNSHSAQRTTIASVSV